MIKWEYRWQPLVTSDIDGTFDNLNLAGHAGWELVAIIPGSDNKAPSGLSLAVLKRPLVGSDSN